MAMLCCALKVSCRASAITGTELGAEVSLADGTAHGCAAGLPLCAVRHFLQLETHSSPLPSPAPLALHAPPPHYTCLPWSKLRVPMLSTFPMSLCHLILETTLRISVFIRPVLQWEMSSKRWSHSEMASEWWSPDSHPPPLTEQCRPPRRAVLQAQSWRRPRARAEVWALPHTGPEKHKAVFDSRSSNFCWTLSLLFSRRSSWA